MKTIFKITAFLLLSLTLLSCDKNDAFNDIEDQNLNYSTFFEKVSSMDLKTSKENVIYIDYEWDNINKTIKYLGSEEKEPDFFILESSKSLDNKKAEKYSVSCENGDDSWTESCTGQWTCGRLIATCLDEGGCATICKRQMIYLPDINKFYILN